MNPAHPYQGFVEQIARLDIPENEDEIDDLGEERLFNDALALYQLVAKARTLLKAGEV